MGGSAFLTEGQTEALWLTVQKVETHPANGYLFAVITFLKILDWTAFAGIAFGWMAEQDRTMCKISHELLHTAVFTNGKMITWAWINRPSKIQDEEKRRLLDCKIQKKTQGVQPVLSSRRDQHDSFVFWSSRAHTVRWKGLCDGHQSAYQTDLKRNWKWCVQFKLYIDSYRGLQTWVVYKRSNYRSAYKSFSLCWECEQSYNPDTLYNVKRNSLC